MTMVLIVNGFSIVMYGCESWTIKKAEHQRIYPFESWCCRRLLRVPWTARSWNQSILKEISWNSNTLATLCKELIHWKGPWCWERLKTGGEGDDRGQDGWMASPTWWIWVWASFGSWRWTGKPCMLQSMGSQIVRHDWASELNWWEKVPSVNLSILYQYETAFLKKNKNAKCV